MHMCIFFVAVDWKITYFFKFYLRPWIVFIEHRISFQICSLVQISLLILFIVTLNKNFRYKTKYQLPPPPPETDQPPPPLIYSHRRRVITCNSICSWFTKQCIYKVYYQSVRNKNVIIVIM